MSGLWRPPDKRARRPDSGTAPHKDRSIGSSNGNRVLTPSTPAAQPRRIRLRSFRPLQRNTLVGAVGQFDLQLDDGAVHEKDGGFWVGMPARAMVGADGAVVRNENGKISYVAIVRWSNKAARDAFSAAVVRLVRTKHPEAFGEGEP